MFCSVKAIFVQIRRAKSIAAIHVTMSQSVSFCLWECGCNRADRSGDLGASRHLVLMGSWCLQCKQHKQCLKVGTSWLPKVVLRCWYQQYLNTCSTTYAVLITRRPAILAVVVGTCLRESPIHGGQLCRSIRLTLRHREHKQWIGRWIRHIALGRRIVQSNLITLGRVSFQGTSSLYLSANPISSSE